MKKKLQQQQRQQQGKKPLYQRLINEIIVDHYYNLCDNLSIYLSSQSIIDYIIRLYRIQ